MLYKYNGLDYQTIIIEAPTLHEAMGKMHDVFQEDIKKGACYTPFTYTIEGDDIVREVWEHYPVSENQATLEKFLSWLKDFTDEWHKASNWEEVNNEIVLINHN